MSRRDGAIYVGRLSKNTRTRDLEEIFEPYGRLLRCDIKHGSEMAYAFIDFEDRRDAEDCVKYENGRELNGQSMIVEWAKGGRDRRLVGPPRQSYDECFRCRRVGHWARDCPELRFGRRGGGGGGGRWRSPSPRKRSRSRSRDRRRRSRSRSRSRGKRRSRSRDRKRSRSDSDDRKRSRSRSGSRDRKSRSRSRDRKSRSVDKKKDSRSKSRSKSNSKSPRRSKSPRKSKSPRNSRSQSPRKSKSPARSKSPRRSKSGSKSRSRSVSPAKTKDDEEPTANGNGDAELAQTEEHMDDREQGKEGSPSGGED